MTRQTIVVLADDLTGAAELASAAHNRELDATIVTGEESSPAFKSDVVVIDSDSRLLPPETAARKVGRIVSQIPAALRQRVFKKTDSVLRGPVTAELEAACEALGLPCALLVPANPSLGRTIADGIYRINGQPLDQTGFAHDPHHPAHSALVRDLLSPSKKFPLTLATPPQVVPASGIVLGQTTSPNDTDHWASQLNATTLPAGGADFFEAFLRNLGHGSKRQKHNLHPVGPTLVISGSASTTSETTRDKARQLGWPMHAMPADALTSGNHAASLKNWITTVQHSLATRGLAYAITGQPLRTDSNAAHAISDTFITLARQLQDTQSFGHLIIEGGATAAAVLQALGWNTLASAGSWAPGIAALHPRKAPSLLITLKPGSYAWPASLWEIIAPQNSATAS